MFYIPFIRLKIFAIRESEEMDEHLSFEAPNDRSAKSSLLFGLIS